jgi:hypothetical protein
MEGNQRHEDQNSHQGPPDGLRPQDRKPAGVWPRDVEWGLLAALAALTGLDTVACHPAWLGGLEFRLFPEQSLQTSERATRADMRSQGPSLELCSTELERGPEKVAAGGLPRWP